MAKRVHPPPATRRLRIYSFDPALAARYDLAAMSGVTIEIPWEDLKPGPVGEYLEVVDVDPASHAAYPPVDLDARELVASDGLAPSESDPQFHQQMCYAVAMKTIEHFERALGRRALWATHRFRDADKRYQENYVPRLRIYPHALRQKNAFYSPRKKALLFGYFEAQTRSRDSTPGSTVFSCLSHDIIAHETTHALLDGVHPRFNEPVNEDVLAFHEAFADIVALFQHFSYPGVLRDQIGRTRGDLARRQSVLGEMAQQFAAASGRGASLRSYLGKEENGQWIPVRPDPTQLERTPKAHDRGAILVAAVFGAFTKVYEARTRDLFRIASEGTGVLREGDIHPDLVNRLAEEAQRCSERALQMCIRAIDYCPPVGITFGSYLRAIVTADYDMNPVDRENWRLAFIESFRAWGIAPPNARSMAEDSLLWPTEEDVVREQVKADAVTERRRRESGAADCAASADAATQESFGAARSRRAMEKMFQAEPPPGPHDEGYEQKASRRVSLRREGREGGPLKPMPISLERDEIWGLAERQAAKFHAWLLDEDVTWLARALGLVVQLDGLPMTIASSSRRPDRATIEIHAVRTAMKRGKLGFFSEPHMVVVVTQWRAGFLDAAVQAAKDTEPLGYADPERDFKYRAGCTLLIDPEGMKVRRVIRTPGTVADDGELNRMREYLLSGLAPSNAFQGVAGHLGKDAEPFALLHAHGEE